MQYPGASPNSQRRIQCSRRSPSPALSKTMHPPASRYRTTQPARPRRARPPLGGSGSRGDSAGVPRQPRRRASRSAWCSIFVNFSSLPGGIESFLSARITVKNLLLLSFLMTAWPIVFRLFGLYDAGRVRLLRSEAARLLVAVTVGTALTSIVPLTSIESESHPGRPAAFLAGYAWPRSAGAGGPASRGPGPRPARAADAHRRHGPDGRAGAPGPSGRRNGPL